MLTDGLLLLLGPALIIQGGDWFVAAAGRLAEFLRMPRVVIGSTLVSLATTTPELTVSITAGTRGESGLAVGNAVGSCICNIGLILGVAAALKQVDVHPPALRTPLLAMFGFGALLLVMTTLDLTLSRRQGLVLIAGGVGYFIHDFLRHARSIQPADPPTSQSAQECALPGRWAWLHSKRGSLAQFLAGAGVLVVGSRLLVGAAVKVASTLGILSILLGLTVVAVGTSLPKLITAVTSSRKNVSDLAPGNVLGANIANLTFIVGTAAVLSDVKMSRPAQLFNFPAMLVMFGLLLWMLFTDRRVTRREGVTLLVSYSLYLSGLVLLTATLKR